MVDVVVTNLAILLALFSARNARRPLLEASRARSQATWEVREFALQIILAVMLGILTVLFYHVGILKKICEAHQSLHDYCIDFSNSSDDVFVIELLIDESKLLHVARILPFIDDGL